MYTTKTIIAVAAILGLATATPLAKRQSCDVFPWFINAQTATDCTAPQPPVSPASGPAPGNAVTCQPLDANGATYVAAAVNIACEDTGYPYDVVLYSTGDCSDAGVVATGGANCYVAPDGQPFVMYSAIRQF